MFCLDIVPNEIFVQIFTSLAKPDLARASQTCRRFQALTDHLRYSHVIVNDVGDPSALLQFLRTILERPILVNYVRSLQILWTIQDRNVDGKSLNAGEITLFTAAARNVGVLGLPESPGLQVVLLLYMLPNVRSLMFIPPDEFDTFAEFMQDLAVSRTAALPAALRSVRDITYHPICIAADVIPLPVMLNLPSIRKIHVKGLCGSSVPAIDLSTFTGTSSVTDFRFWYCTLSTSTLTRVLEISTGLTYFSYVDQRGNPNDFKSALFGHALRGSRTTLQYLRLTFANTNRYRPAPYRGDSLGSLHDYPALRSLWCPFSVLLGTVPKMATQSLVCVLPPGIEELRVGSQAFDRWTFPAIVQQVMEVVEQKRVGGFRKLVKVTMMPRSTGVVKEEALRAACDAVGVTLVIGDDIIEYCD